MIAACQCCGSPQYGEGPTPSMCESCPPRPCWDCGAMDSMQNPCTCWVSFDGMSHADIKAAFSADGTFNVNTDGTIGWRTDADSKHC